MLAEKFSLEGKTAMVTGGGTGLGKAISLALARAGADIALAARRRQPLEETAAEVRGLGRRALVILCDVTKSEEVNSMVETAIAEFGKVDILVNNAGGVAGLTTKPIWEISDEEWHIGIDNNLTGTFFCSRALSKHMVERKSGTIINMASYFGFRGIRQNFMYGPAKAGVILLTKSLALTLASDGIRVNALAPGLIMTYPDLDQKYYGGKYIPVQRLGVPAEVGSLAVYLASDASAYVTGQAFVIDGGNEAAGYALTGYAPEMPLEAKEEP